MSSLPPEGPPHESVSGVEAELVDAENRRPVPPLTAPKRRRSLGQRWRESLLVTKVFAIASPLILVAMCSGPPAAFDSAANNGDQVSAGGAVGLQGSDKIVVSDGSREAEPDGEESSDGAEAASLGEEAQRGTVQMECTNPRRGYFVTFDAKARTFTASAGEGDTSYEVRSVEELPEGFIVFGNTPGNGPPFVARLFSPKSITYGEDQVDACR